MKFSMLACAWAAALACAACSQGSQEPAAPVPSASSPAVPATRASPAGVMTTAGSAAAATMAKPVAPPVYLFDLLQRPDFAQALGALPEAQALPAWVRTGGTATPAETVQLDGKSMLLATACKPHDCPTERVVLLYDAQSHAMWGLFAQRPGNLPPAVDPADSSQDRLTWLGAPDPGRRKLLRDALYAR